MEDSKCNGSGFPTRTGTWIQITKGAFVSRFYMPYRETQGAKIYRDEISSPLYINRSAQCTLDLKKKHASKYVSMDQCIITYVFPRAR